MIKRIEPRLTVFICWFFAHPQLARDSAFVDDMPRILPRAEASACDIQRAQDATTWLAQSVEISRRRKIRVDFIQHCDDGELQALADEPGDLGALPELGDPSGESYRAQLRRVRFLSKG